MTGKAVTRALPSGLPPGRINGPDNVDVRDGDEPPMVDAEAVRRVALSLPRTEEHLVRDRVKFRVGRIVYASLSRDEAVMGFGFPREERVALVASAPGKFLMPLPADERYQWVRVRLAAIDEAEMRELVVDAWRMVVPKKVAAAYAERMRLSAPDDERQ
ncbi:MAG TPA: MmcQ/YjbR family DNA-binding protein [Streptosporangiaceae bacterium]|nr:MmcQ/YjbR family DNA-binding protein [Streptosporangiaceae bacterium]